MAEYLQPISRSCCFSAAAENDVYLWLKRSRDSDSSSVSFYYPNLKTWKVHPTDGIQPPGRYYSACANLGSSLYTYGVRFGSIISDCLFELNIKTLLWNELRVHTKERPMKKYGSAMVVQENKFILFGGCSRSRDCTNKLHLHDLSKS